MIEKWLIQASVSTGTSNHRIRNYWLNQYVRPILTVSTGVDRIGVADSWNGGVTTVQIRPL